MNYRITLLTMALLLLCITIEAQNILDCSNGTSYWVIEKDGAKYALKLNDKVTKVGHPSMISYNDYALQTLVVDVAPYTGQQGDNSDIGVLTRYAQAESEYLSGQFKTEVEITMKKVKISKNREVLVWYYNMPASVSTEVENQLYANIIVGDQIFGLSCTQFNGQSFDEARNMLMDVISTLQVTKDTTGLCK